MNFPPFGSPFSSPSIHQFASSSMNASSNIQDVNNRYNSSSSNIMNIPHFNQSPAAQIPKFNASNAIGNKYGSSTPGMTSMTGDYSSNGTSIASSPSLNAMHSNADDKNVRNYQQNFNSNISPNQSQMPELTQDLCNALLNQQTDAKKVLQNMNSGWQSALAPTSAVADYLSHLPASTLPLSLHHFLKYSAENIKKENSEQSHYQNMSQSLNLNSLGTSLLSNAGIFNHLSPPPTNQPQQTQMTQSNLLPTAPTTSMNSNANASGPNTTNIAENEQLQKNSPPNSESPKQATKKKKKKKPPKEKKPRPRPGEIRLKTALDGSTLYCCPECQVAYPERGLLEQHLVGHNLERKFICDICNAALKRKDHLTRHKQSHNPERPFVCTVCMKAFKRKEQLSLHFVIHSGEKRHLCNECGKGFYRKDHLRKHTRSHISRRLKAELSHQNPSPNLIAAQQLQQQMQQSQPFNGESSM